MTTVKEIKERLDELGVEYPKNAKKDELCTLLGNYIKGNGIVRPSVPDGSGVKWTPPLSETDEGFIDPNWDTK